MIYSSHISVLFALSAHILVLEILKTRVIHINISLGKKSTKGSNRIKMRLGVGCLPRDLFSGLSSSDAELMRAEFGSNTLTEKRRVSFFRRFISNFGDPIIRILLGALCVNVILNLRDINWIENIGIAAAVLIATLVSAISEAGGENAFRMLEDSVSGSAVTVLRDGERVKLPIAELTVGDVFELSAGDRIPADAVLISGELSMDQSALDGESTERKKRPIAHGVRRVIENAVETRSVGELSGESSLFRGSSVLSGEGEAIVAVTGDYTLYGKVALGVQSAEEPSPMKLRLTELAKKVGFIGYIAAAMIAFAYLFNVFVIDSGMNADRIIERLSDIRYVAREALKALTLAVSVIVVAVPEGLPMMITVVLSSNMKRMMKRGVLVRRLAGIETAGSLGILFTDKTGTLTVGKMSVTEVITADAEYRPASEIKKAQDIHSLIVRSNSFCCGKGGGNFTDKALLSCFGKGEHGYTSVRRLPFDSGRKFAASEHVGSGGREVIIRGAPEILLARCESVLSGGEVRQMTARDRARLYSALERLNAAASRVIAVCVGGSDGFTLADFEGGASVCFCALIAMRDRVRREVPRAVEDCINAGIKLIMVTGDSIGTAIAVGKECGICKSGSEALLGSELALLSDEELDAKLMNISIIARALPQDKLRLVEAAIRLGKVVGMTGDGINDAAAMSRADVSFAMGSGCDVAKEAGDIIITDDSFASISNAVLFGRSVFKNIRKFILFQFTMNLSALGVSLIGPFIGYENPVTVIQMLWVNIIMDTLGGIAFAGEAPLREYMREEPIRKNEPILDAAAFRQIAFGGAYTVLASVVFLLHDFDGRFPNETYLLTVFFAMFIFMGIVHSFLSRSDRIFFLANLTKNKPFIIIMTAVALIQLTLIYFGGEVFRMTPIAPRDLCLSALWAASVVIFEILRRISEKAIRKRFMRDR